MEEYQGITFNLHEFKISADTISIFATIDHPELLKQDISLNANFIQIRNSDFTIDVKSFCDIYSDGNTEEFHRLANLLFHCREKSHITIHDIVFEFLESAICPILNKILTLNYHKF